MSLICGSGIPEQSNGQLNLQVSANGPTRFLRVATCSETPGNGEQWGLSLRSIVVALLQCAHHPVLCSILSKTRGKAVSRPKEPRSPTSFAGFNSWWLSAKFRMSAEVWGEITGLDMKASRIPVVEMQLCSCVRYPPIVRRCLKQATCIMWIIPDVAGLQLPSIGS